MKFNSVLIAFDLAHAHQ